MDLRSTLKRDTIDTVKGFVICTAGLCRGQNYFNIALVLQDERLAIFTRPANICACPFKAYEIKKKNI